jgi:DNA adenine methylase
MENKSINKRETKPFLRWAGGKTWLLKELDKFLPQKFNNYYEPFLGGGAVFFYLKQKGKLNREVVLSDINKELINCFKRLCP